MLYMLTIDINKQQSLDSAYVYITVRYMIVTSPYEHCALLGFSCFYAEGNDPRTLLASSLVVCINVSVSIDNRTHVCELSWYSFKLNFETHIRNHLFKLFGFLFSAEIMICHRLGKLSCLFTRADKQCNT